MKRRTSRWLSILLALCLALALLPGTALAAASGSCGENVTWSYSGGTLTIQGTGKMSDYGSYMGYSLEPNFLEDEKNSVVTVVIGDGVTHIGGAAFRDFKSLTRVVIPNSVTSIGEAAFYRCRELTSVTIPDGVTEIGDYAFSYCESLTSVTIPGSVTSIGTSVFSDCSSLTSATILDGVTEIGDYAFSYCKSLTSVTIPDGVTSIGADAFRGCSSLTNVIIPDSVTSIEERAFASCTSLTSVSIPNSVTTIEEWAFYSCVRLTSIDVANGNPAYRSVDGVLFSKNWTLLHTYPAGKSDTTYRVPDSVTTIGESAFGYCLNLSSVNIPDSVTNIGMRAFDSCANLTSVNIPNSVTTIEEWAFYACGLSSVTIPGRLTSIEGNIFYLCKNLTSVTIPASVTSIGASAFAWCESLTDIYYGGSESQWEQVDIDNTTFFSGANNLRFLLNATIHYNSTAPSTPAAVAVTVNSKAVAFPDAKPFIDANDRTMVPLRAVADAMGLNVNWDATAREASFTGSGKTITFPIDSSTARTSGGNTVTMDTAAVIVNDRTYAPIRYLAEYFGYTVGWDAATRTVTITG